MMKKLASNVGILLLILCVGVFTICLVPVLLVYDCYEKIKKK